MHVTSYFLEYLHVAIQESSTIVQKYGLWIVFAALFLESSGVVFLPGETLLIGAGFIASEGKLNPLLLLILSIAGTTCGWFSAYYIGYHFGINWIRKHGRWIGITTERVRKTHIFLAKYGSIVVLFARFIVPLRQLQGYISGSAETSFKDFYIWNFLGAILWVFFWGGAGFILGRL
ncbi:MAG: DedA family protein [Acidithiobacillus sp.]